MIPKTFPKPFKNHTEFKVLSVPLRWPRTSCKHTSTAVLQIRRRALQSLAKFRGRLKWPKTKVHHSCGTMPAWHRFLFSFQRSNLLAEISCERAAVRWPGVTLWKLLSWRIPNTPCVLMPDPSAVKSCTARSLTPPQYPLSSMVPGLKGLRSARGTLIVVQVYVLVWDCRGL